MSIPKGTKFHGVAPGISTVNKGSAQLNAGRDAYTIEDVCISCTESINLLSPVLFVTASPGASKTLTEIVNVVDFEWVSGTPGTYELILPSATDIPFRKIRFVNDGTISASNKIAITAPAGETIDGAAVYEITKPYNGCAVWSDGTQWIVIQAKAT